VSSLPLAADALSKGFRSKAEEILDKCPLELRHLEWNLLKRACKPDLTLDDHQLIIMGVVSDLAGGDLIATATRDGTVRLLDSKTGDRVRVVEEGHEGISNLVSGNQGRYLAAVWEDGTVRAWEVTGKEHKRVFDESVGATTVALARDRPTIAAAGRSKVTVWDVPSAKQLHSLEYPADIYAVGLSPDGEGLAAGGWNKDCPLKVWNLRTGKEATHFQIKQSLGKEYTVYALAWGGSPNREHLVAATHNGASFWNAATGKFKGSLPNYEPRATSLAFDRTGGHLAVGFVSGRLRIYDEDRKVVFSRGRRAGGRPARVADISFDPTGSQIAYASGAEVCVDRWKNRFGVRTEQGRRAAFSPDGTYLAVARDGEVQVLDSQSLQPALKRIRAHESPITSMVFHPKDSARLVTAASDGTVKMWDLNDLANPIPPLPCNSPVLDLAYSSDGRLLACATESGTVLVVNAITAKPMFAPLERSTQVRGVSFSPDGKYLATASRDEQVTLWDMTTGKPKVEKSDHLLGVNAVAFGPACPDSCWLASASDDGVKLWRIVESDLRRSPDRDLPHQGKVYHVAFSPDGMRVVTVGQDGHVRFWETATGQELVTLPRSDPDKRSAASQVIMNPRRSQMAVVFDETIEVWDGTGDWETAAKNR
jgi:WD40 repeat protein